VVAATPLAWRVQGGSGPGAGAAAGDRGVARKRARKVKGIGVETMAAMTRATGIITARAIVGPPSRPATTPNTVPTARKTSSQPRPYMVNALKFFRQATRLKNRLLAGDTPCQWTRAGACQNIRNSGRCSTSASSMEASRPVSPPGSPLPPVSSDARLDASSEPAV